MQLNSACCRISVINQSTGRQYTGYFDLNLCLGEVIRNCCVNIGIDPDTVDGITKNVIVRRRAVDISQDELFNYRPYAHLREVLDEDNSIELIFEEIA
jgi:hypothetical protein